MFHVKTIDGTFDFIGLDDSYLIGRVLVTPTGNLTDSLRNCDINDLKAYTLLPTCEVARVLKNHIKDIKVASPKLAELLCGVISDKSVRDATSCGYFDPDRVVGSIFPKDVMSHELAVTHGRISLRLAYPCGIANFHHLSEKYARADRSFLHYRDDVLRVVHWLDMGGLGLLTRAFGYVHADFSQHPLTDVPLTDQETSKAWHQFGLDLLGEILFHRSCCLDCNRVLHFEFAPVSFFSRVWRMRPETPTVYVPVVETDEDLPYYSDSDSEPNDEILALIERLRMQRGCRH